MLEMEQLTQFEEYLRNGTIEECFKCGDEKERVRILELLEKIMDIAELADETATKLIYRGLPHLGKDAGPQK